ncbi:hypothetical protein XIS1_1050023 [Xenorhabdus innexi]|uniref:Uncharacterized protein n=1 Tax=Xenorhabdus innexi TaxID=290109 RepID=A0A1N6MQS6_9GAMM|nr:hypothetical protein XIS1_1050023 [Xenorhabdus innexi]
MESLEHERSRGLAANYPYRQPIEKGGNSGRDTALFRRSRGVGG